MLKFAKSFNTLLGTGLDHQVRWGFDYPGSEEYWTEWCFESVATGEVLFLTVGTIASNELEYGYSKTVDDDYKELTEEEFYKIAQRLKVD